ncbi:MAG TPA: sodium/proton-translocating pyrophosphatase, partial [bacterium]|nr:sodium/proton-translocating pyrophosphatase [bacterium]HPO52787.1 sodium/proton-translocating pyrophosphatase [bacterium]
MLVSIGSIIIAFLFALEILRKDAGNEKMQEIANAIKEGAGAFLKRQYTTIAVLSITLAIIIFLIYALSGKLTYGWHTSFAFILGALCSSISGYVGMYISVRSNSRAASAAGRSMNEALVTALKGGAVSGILVVALSLLGVAGIFLLYGGSANPLEVPLLIVGFGFGASFVALFAQLGGGIYTKAADVGADLVGKVEAGIPEDDPRNPAVIADLVGDNVG